MSFSIVTIRSFERQATRLYKKFPSLKAELHQLFTSLSTNPQQGIDLGRNCYKIRLAIKSKGRGKSGGGRVITNVKVTAHSVYMLSIYDKSEKENLTDKELRDLLRQIPSDS